MQFALDVSWLLCLFLIEQILKGDFLHAQHHSAVQEDPAQGPWELTACGGDRKARNTHISRPGGMGRGLHEGGSHRESGCLQGVWKHLKGVLRKGE